MAKKRFLFDIHDFDDPDKQKPEETAQVIAPAPTYSEDELRIAIETAKDDGMRKGKQEGFREAEEGFTKQLHDITITLRDEIQGLINTESDRHEKTNGALYDLIVQALETALPSLVARGDLVSVQILIADILKTHSHEDGLVVTTHKDYIEPLENYFGQDQGDNTPKLQFVAQKETDENILATTKITWEHGGAIHNPEALKENIQKVLEEALAENELTPQNEQDKKRETENE